MKFNAKHNISLYLNKINNINNNKKFYSITKLINSSNNENKNNKIFQSLFQNKISISLNSEFQISKEKIELEKFFFKKTNNKSDKY